LSLARAFFAGGAGGVLATRWPLRDDDAAFVMARFYRALGAGHGLAASLRRARRDAIEAGLPAAAWAGVALLGDGSRNPIRPRTATGGWPWLVVIAVAMAAGIEWIDASRRRGTKQALREFHGLGRS
jgi:hypothetical protein